MDKTFYTIAAFQNTIDAEIARARLESEGIPAFVRDANMVGMNWMMSNAIGGVKLEVESDDVLRAREILNLPSNQSRQDEGWGACPNCGSRQLELQIDRRATNLTWLLFGIPLLFPRKRFQCKACGKSCRKLDA